MPNRANLEIEKLINELHLSDPAAAERLMQKHGYHFASDEEDAALSNEADATKSRIAFDDMFGKRGDSNE